MTVCLYIDVLYTYELQWLNNNNNDDDDGIVGDIDWVG